MVCISNGHLCTKEIDGYTKADVTVSDKHSTITKANNTITTSDNETWRYMYTYVYYT